MTRLIRILLPALVSLPLAAEEAVTFEDHIKPIFREHCLKCYGEDEQKADLNLQTFAAPKYFSVRLSSGRESLYRTDGRFQRT